MAYREVTRVDIQEIIRRWQAGEGYRRIAAGASLSRNTVRKYLSAAKAEGITKDGSAPTDDQLSHPSPARRRCPSECLSQPILSSTYRANESTLHLSALNISSPPVLLAAVLDQVHRGLLGASPASPAVPTGPGGCGCASARRGCGAPAGLPVRPEPGAVAPARARPAAPGRRCWPAWA